MPATAEGNEETKIAVAGVDQYGKEISIKDLNKNDSSQDVKVEATVNGMPLKTGEVTFKEGTVTIKDFELKENDDLVITLTHKVNDDVTTKSTIEYKVQKAEEAKVTTIELTTEDNKTSVPSGEKIVFNAKAFDQFKSPTDADLRWVVNGKTVEAENGSYTLNTKTPGEYKVQVFSVDNSKVKAEKTVTIGAAELTTLTLDEENVAVEDLGVTAKEERFNHEELVIGTLTPNEGAALLASNVNFHVEPGKDVEKEDITVTAEEMEDKDGNKVIVVKATTTKPGTFKVTPFVGEEFTGKDTVKTNTPFTVTTEVNTEVAEISDVKFDAKDLKVGATPKAEIVIKNKHGEVLNADQVTGKVDVKSSKEAVATGNIIQGKKDVEDVNKTYLALNNLTEGTTVLTIQAGKVVKTVQVDVVGAELTTIKPEQSKVTGVVAGDADADADGKTVDSKKATYNKISYLDQDGKEMDAPEGAKVTVKDAKGEEKAAEDFIVKLGGLTVDKDGEVTEFNADAKKTHVQIAPKSTVEKGTYTVEVSVGEDKEAVKATFQVVVDEARAAKTVELSTEADKVVVGGTTDIMITPKDQYGEFIEVNPTDNIKVTSSSVAVVGTESDNKAFKVEEVKDPKGDAKVIGYKVKVTGEAKGSANIKVAVNKDGKELATATQAITVEDTTAIADVEIKEVEGLQNAGTAEGVQLEAIVKDEAGKVVNVKDEDLTWSIKAVKDAKGNYLKLQENEQGNYTVTFKDAEGEEKTATLEIKDGKLKVTNSDSPALAGLTVDVTVGVQTQNFKEAETTVTIGDAAPFYVEDFKVATVNGSDDFEGDGTTAEITSDDAKITFTFSGLDQYGEDFPITEGVTVATSDANDLVATWSDTDSADKLTVEAKNGNGGQVYVKYKSSDSGEVKEATLTLNITVSPEVAKTLEEK